MLHRHGLLLVDKPVGWTSHDVVAFIRKKLGQREVGHCGTLDPAATGLLVVLLGEATKLSQYLLEQDKTYEMNVRMGIRTTTQDLDGEVVSETEVDLPAEKIREVVESLQGEIVLPVPSYSAVKVGGERLYKKARRGEEVDTPERTMTFYDLEIGEIGPDRFTARIRCHKGSYVRSWAAEVGERLGVGAALAGLRRLRSEPFSIDQAISLEQVEESAAQESWRGGFIPMAEALSHWKAVRVAGMDERLLRNGQISQGLRSQLIRIFQPDRDLGVRILSATSDLLALVGLEPGRGFVIRRVFRY